MKDQVLPNLLAIIADARQNMFQRIRSFYHTDVDYAGTLLQIKESLTDETWGKGRFFDWRNDMIYMCVNGACQKIVNPKIVQMFIDEHCNYDLSTCAQVEAWIVYHEYYAAEVAELAVIKNRDKKIAWKKRKKFRFGHLNVHYLMGLFGLTSNFNDSMSTTLPMIHHKFDQAIAWSKENHYFLNSN